MKCININDPQVQQFIGLFGQVTTSAIIDEYNKSYADRDLDLDLANFIFSRLQKEDKKKFERPIVSRYVTDIEAFQKLLVDPKYFQEIQDYLNSINWFEVSAAANKKLKQNKPRALQRQVEKLEDFTPEQAREMAEGLIVYLTETYNYVDKTKRDLRSYFRTEGVPLTDKYKRGYFTLKMVNGLLGDLKTWKATMKEALDANNIVARTIDSLESAAKDIENLFKEEAVETIAEELANEIAPQTDKLLKENQKEIDEVTQEIKTEKDPIVVGHLKKRKEFLENQRKLFASKESLMSALKFGMGKVGEKDIWTLSYYMESAALTSNLITGSIGSFIYNLHNETQKDVLEWETKMKNLSQRMLKKFGGRIKGEFDKEPFLAPYVRKVKKMEIDKNGNKKYYEVYALNSEMDEHGYKLELDERRYAIEQEKDPERKKLLERELDKFREENEYRGLKEEYYKIMSLLSPEAREARKEILDEMQKLSSYGAEDILDEATLDEMAELQYKLDRLESLYYDNGNRKPPGSKDERIALEIQAWKKAKNASKLFIFTPSDERLEEFEATKKQYEEDIQAKAKAKQEAELAYVEQGLDYSAVSTAQFNYNEAVRKYNVWKKTNTRRSVDPEFYQIRQDLINQIANIQSKYISRFAETFPTLRTDSEIWEEIFNLIKGYRDKDGVYRGTDIPVEISQRVKELQVELKENKEVFREFKKLIRSADEDSYKADQKRLQSLYSSLQQLQQYEQTTYYNKARNLHIAQIRALEVYNQSKDNKEIEANFKKYYAQYLQEAKREFPKGTLAEHQRWASDKANGLVYTELAKQQETLEAKVQKRFKESKWFQDNHISTLVWDQTTEQMEEKDMPLYFWSEILPRNEVFIDYGAPSSRWNSFSINPEFVEEGYKYTPGRTLLRSSSSFRNPEYDNLDQEQKEYLAELTALYQERQEDIPYSVAKGLELPSVRKRTQTNVIDYINPIKRVKTWGTNLWDDVRGVDEEDDAFYKGSPKASNEAQRRLMLRYTSKMDTSIQSMDALTSIAMFGADSIRFSKIFEKSPFLYGLRDQLNDSTDFAGTNVLKMVNSLYDKHLFGHDLKMFSKKDGLVSTTERAIYKASDEALAFSNLVFIGTKLPSAFKNLLANLYNSFVQAGTYDISWGDLKRGLGVAVKHIDEIFIASIQTGNESEFVKKLRMFGIYDENVSEKARMLNPSDLQKLNLVNPFKLLTFVREFLDIETRVAAAHAIAQTFMFQDNNGNNVSIFDAYKEVNGIMTVRDDLFIMKDETKIKATPEDIESIRREYIGRYHSVDALINGAQKNIDRGELMRYGLGKLLMFMKSWLTYQVIRRFGGKRISYGGGFVYEGMYRALADMGVNYFMNLPIAFKNWNGYMATSKQFTKAQKKAALAGLLDTAGILTLMGIVWALSAISYGDDPEKNKLLRWLQYTLGYLLDEVETLHPVGSYGYLYARQFERNSKDNAFVYFFRKNLLDPYNSVYDLYKGISLFTRPEVNITDDFIQRDQSGNVLNRKDVPVNPALATPLTSIFGETNSELYAQFLKVSGLASNINWIRNPEYTYSSFKHFYPKFYVKDIKEDVETLGAEIKDYKNRIKALRLQLKKETIAEREEAVRLLIKDEQTRLNEALEERKILKDLQDDNVIQ